MGEVVAALCLSKDRQCRTCAHFLAAQCVALMSEHLCYYASQMGAAREELARGSEMHGAIKEQAIDLVRTGQQATLEDALEHLGCSPKMARRIF